jgi:inhibitor of growth protein 3
LNLEKKLNTLIKWIQDPTIGTEERFQLLQEIAEEAARYKLGGDDKIRVAGGACDGVSTYTSPLRIKLIVVERSWLIKGIFRIS